MNIIDQQLEKLEETIKIQSSKTESGWYRKSKQRNC